MALVQAALSAQAREGSSRDGRAVQAARLGAAARARERSGLLSPGSSWAALEMRENWRKKRLSEKVRTVGFFLPFDER